MKLGKALVWINCVLFLAFGLGFVLAPEALARLITGGIPATASAAIDMRATYGGMALGLAVIFGLCARNPAHLRLGLQGVLAVMVALAGARVLGILLDGNPNTFMFILLAAEVLMAGLVSVGLRGTATGEPSNQELEPTV